MLPVIKLIPIVNPIGNFTVSSINKLILDLFELFCNPIIRTKNKLKLKDIEKKNFLIEKFIII